MNPCKQLRELRHEEMSSMKSHGVDRDALQRFDSRTSGTAVDNGRSAVELAEPGQEAVNVVSREDVPPDGGYGWICAACVFFINAHTWGINSVGKTWRDG